MANDKNGPAGHKPAPRILLADDVEDAADSLATCLQAHGCEVFVAWAGDEAVSLAEKHKPDILILDVEMPGLNGYEVARYVRAQPWGSKPVLIAHTGLSEASDRQDGKDAGFDHYLSKPFNLEELTALILDCGYSFDAVDPTR